MNKFAPWEPDRPVYAGAASEAQNVVPVADGYGPLPSLMRFGNFAALSITGLTTAKYHDGTYRLFVGDTSGKVFEMGSDLTTLTTRIDVGSAVTTRWSFTQYGDLVIGANESAAPQVWDMKNSVASTISITSGESLKPKFITTFRNFLVFGRFSDADTSSARSIHWSAIDSPTSFPTLGLNQSDQQAFPNPITGIAPGVTSVDGFVFTDVSVYAATYVGTPLIFQFNVLDPIHGCIAPYSIVAADKRCYFLSDYGLCAVDASGVQNIGQERVNRWFFGIADINRLAEEMTGVYLRDRGFVVWTFPSTAAPAGVCDTQLIYSIPLDRWSYSKQPISFLSPLRSLPASMDSGPSSINTLYPNLDAMTPSLDSTQFQGGAFSAGGFKADGLLYSYSGSPMQGIVETVESSTARTMIHGIRPYVLGDSPLVALGYRDSLGQNATFTNYTSVSNFDQFAPFHKSARYFRARVKTTDGRLWTHALGAEFKTEEDGQW